MLCMEVDCQDPLCFSQVVKRKSKRTHKKKGPIDTASDYVSGIPGSSPDRVVFCFVCSKQREKDPRLFFTGKEKCVFIWV